MKEALAHLAAVYGLTVIPQGQGWDIPLPVRDNCMCELHIGPGACDWSASVVDPADGRELWSDWMDYLGYDKRPEVQLIEEKQQDLGSFVATWIAATGVRVTRTRKAILWGLRHKTRVEVEWEHAGIWQPIQIWEKLPPNKRMQLPARDVQGM